MKLTANPAWLSLPPNGGIGSGAKFLRIMKLTTILILAACLHTSAKGVAQQTITFSGKEVSLENVFNAIKKQTNYRFFFNTDMLQNASKVTLEVKNAQIEQVMNMALKDQPLTFAIKGRTIFIMKKPEEEKKSVQVERTGDPITVSGRVTDENGEPLVGANVKVKGGNNGITTDNQGRFTLINVDPNASLEISFVGRETQTLSVQGKSVFSVTLGQKVGTLDETIVIAYGTTSRRFATGNVASVKSSDIEKQPVNNPLLAIQGRVAGLEITQASGVPGTSVKVRIRGQNSFGNGNEPLYVIDGVPYTSQLLPGLGSILGQAAVDLQGNSIYGNPLSYINPSDIESIDVLKDADATAIYGSRAANGAILITTRKGKAGKVKIDVNAYTGWGKITRTQPVLSLDQYLTMRKDAFQNDGTNPDPNYDYDLTLWDSTHNTDWQKYFIGGTSRYNNIQTSASGGNNQVQYLIGAGYNKETTVFPGNFDDTKASVHFNITSSSTNQKLKFSLTGTYLSDNNKLLQQDLTRYIYLAPNAPDLFNSDGSLNWAYNSSVSATWDNPMTYLMRKYNNQTNNLIGNALVSYEIIQGLEVKTSLGYTSQQSNEISTFPLSSINPNTNPPISSSNFADNYIKSWIAEPQVTYKKQFGKGKLDVLIGSSFQSNSSNGAVLNASGFVTDALIENKKAASEIKITSTTDVRYKYSAAFARLNYNWADKYIINITGRRDGSSRFGPDSRFHNFGAVGAAWIFSNENVIKRNLTFLSLGKIRGSYGTTGNDQIGDYRYIDLYYPTTNNYQGSIGLVANNLFNPALAWEETKKLELSMELGFFSDRVYLSGSYFKNKSTNQLLGYALPSTTGFNRIDANQDALIQNDGFELLLNGTIIQNKNFKWTSSVNFTSSKNKVISLGPDYYGDKTIEGHSLNSTNITRFLGVDPVTGKYQFLSKDGNATFIPDTFYYDKDLNPKYYGGFQNSLSYKGFQLDALFQFVKQIGLNNVFGNTPGMFNGAPNQPNTVWDRWQKTGDVKEIAQYSQDGSLSASNDAVQRSDASYSNASFIRLKNVSISYIIPQYFKRNLRLQNLRVYIQCQNLVTITKYKGSDPETKSFYSLPPLRVITTGVQLTF